MNKAFVKLAYTQVIGNKPATPFEEEVFRDTYSEFLLQVQAYNREDQFTTLEQVIAANPKAHSLHYKVGFSIGLYVKALNNVIPGLKDSLGKANLDFEAYQFQIISSHISDASMHKVSLTYTTDAMTLLGVVGDYLLLSPGGVSAQALAAGVETFMVKMEDGLSVVHYREM